MVIGTHYLHNLKLSGKLNLGINYHHKSGRSDNPNLKLFFVWVLYNTGQNTIIKKIVQVSDWVFKHPWTSAGFRA